MSSELEKWYSTPDPWGYESNQDDIKRKNIILSKLNKYKRALDIGCGEGWITKDLPAKEIYGIEEADLAAERLPKNIKRIDEPNGKYDLIIATGVLYKQYDYEKMTNWIIKHANGLVLTSNIKSWEINKLPQDKQIHEEEFKYREYTQKLRIYDFSDTQHR